MKKRDFERLMQSLEEVREHVTTGKFRGRIYDVEVGAQEIQSVRLRSGMTQKQFRSEERRVGKECRL